MRETNECLELIAMAPYFNHTVPENNSHPILGTCIFPNTFPPS